MHIPDGFLDAKTWVSLDIVSATAIGLALKKIRKHLGDKQIPLIGVMASFIFAAQMLNFPVAGGTSGHFVGGVLAAILLGPFTGFIIMTTILVVQCFIFQDGGLTALGANIFNMGFIGTVFGYYIYKFFRKIFLKTNKGMIISSFISAWITVVISASMCAIELSISGTSPLNVSLPAMAGIHSMIGIGEGLITGLVLSFIIKVRPDLMEIPKI